MDIVPLLALFFGQKGVDKLGYGLVDRKECSTPPKRLRLSENYSQTKNVKNSAGWSRPGVFAFLVLLNFHDRLQMLGNYMRRCAGLMLG